MPAVVVTLAALAGAVWGALLPGLVYRYAVPWPDGEPRPQWRSVRVRCGQGLAPCWLTVPLASGTCALLAAARGARPDLPAFLVLGCLGVLLGLVDHAVLRLPDPLVLAALVAGIVLLAVAALLEADARPLARAGLGALVCGCVYVLLAFAPGSQLGYGDVKLGIALGLYLGWLGWYPVAAGLALAPLVNLAFVLVLLAQRRAGRKTQVPYGPAILIGALGAIVISVARDSAIG